MAEEATTTTDNGGGTTTTPKAFSQEDLDRIVGERLARAKADFSDYDDLKSKAARLDELEQANQTETQRLTKEATTAAERAAAAEGKLMRFEAAAKAGLDPKFALRIQGSTPEEMETDAKQLAEAFKPTADPSTFDGGARQTATDTSFDAMIRRQAGAGA